MTAELSWHVQFCDLTLKSKSEQSRFFKKFQLRTHKPFKKLVPVTSLTRTFHRFHMDHFGIRGVKFFKSYLSNRKQLIHFNNVSSSPQDIFTFRHATNCMQSERLVSNCLTPYLYKTSYSIYHISRMKIPGMYLIHLRWIKRFTHLQINFVLHHWPLLKIHFNWSTDWFTDTFIFDWLTVTFTNKHSHIKLLIQWVSFKEIPLLKPFTKSVCISQLLFTKSHPSSFTSWQYLQLSKLVHVYNKQISWLCARLQYLHC